MNRHEPLPVEIEELARIVVDAAYAVHKTLGPGLLESVYEACLCHELELRAVRFARQLELPVCYRDMRLDAGLRLDLLVAGSIIVEVKAVEKVLPIHQAQLLTYLKLAGKRLGLLINFNVSLVKDGIQRIVL